MPDAPIHAHSLAEAYLFILATPCRSCGRGPLRAGEAEQVNDPAASLTVAIAASCGSCHEVAEWKFQLPRPPREPLAEQVPVVNSTDQPSRILDVAQWLTLFGMMTEMAGKEAEKTAARRLSLEAAQCLDEALKFYEEDNDLPPTGAFFHQGSRDRFRDHPQQFSRQRLLHLRSKLPTRWRQGGSEPRPEGSG